MHNKEFTIGFHFQKDIYFPKRKKIRNFIGTALFKAGKSGCEMNFVFCSDEELLEINRTHLDHDYYTDIITFDLSDEGSSFLLSDIYISVDRVRDNAKMNRVYVISELYRVIFHGVLHLIGFKDKSEKDVQEMRFMEERWLKALAGGTEL